MRVEKVRLRQQPLLHQAQYIGQHERPAERAAVLDREEVRD
jgi:hypothetical protein